MGSDGNDGRPGRYTDEDGVDPPEMVLVLAAGAQCRTRHHEEEPGDSDQQGAGAEVKGANEGEGQIGRPLAARAADTSTALRDDPAILMSSSMSSGVYTNGVPLPNNATSGVTESLIEVRGGGRVRMP
jgi:hypothetical protein